jgi:poly(A) polymerase Pap1
VYNAAPQQQNSVNLNIPVQEFKAQVMEWAGWREAMDVNVRHIRQRDLPAFVDGRAPGATSAAQAEKGATACQALADSGERRAGWAAAVVDGSAC